MIQELHEKKLESGNFGDLFQIDGIPLWYFFQGFINSSFLPAPFRPLWVIEKEIKNGFPPKTGIKSRLLAFTLKKGLTLNEWIKHVIAKRDEKEQKKGKKDVLFIVLTNQIRQKKDGLEFLECGGVLSSLERYKKIKPLILVGDPFSKNSLFKLRRYGPLIYHYITPEIIAKSRQLSKELNERWKRLDEDDKRKLFTYRGRNYWKFFECNMNILFSKEFLFTLIKYYLTCKEILLKHDIKVVYLTSLTNFYDLSLLGAASKLEKTVVYSSHGYTRGTVGGWKLLKNVIFAAGGAEHKKDLLANGVKKENIVVTGFPFLDEIASYIRKRKSKTGGKTVSLLTTTVVESKFMEKKKYFALIREVLKQLKEVPEIKKIIIKLHPAEKHRAEYEKIARSLGMKHVNVTQKTGRSFLYEVINESDALIGFGSTAILEGLVFDKDAIHLKPLESRPVFEFESATYLVKNIDELAKSIRNVLNNNATKRELRLRRRKYLNRSFYKIDGKSSMRIADLIASLVGKNR